MATFNALDVQLFEDPRRAAERLGQDNLQPVLERRSVSILLPARWYGGRRQLVRLLTLQLAAGQRYRHFVVHSKSHPEDRVWGATLRLPDGCCWSRAWLVGAVRERGIGREVTVHCFLYASKNEAEEKLRELGRVYRSRDASGRL